MAGKKNARQNRHQSRSRELRRQEKRGFEAEFYAALDEERQDELETIRTNDDPPINSTIM